MKGGGRGVPVVSAMVRCFKKLVVSLPTLMDPVNSGRDWAEVGGGTFRGADRSLIGVGAVLSPIRARGRRHVNTWESLPPTRRPQT